MKFENDEIVFEDEDYSRSKYVVFKREEWEACAKIHPTLNSVYSIFAIPDAEVIRHQDITAEGVFLHYATQLQSLSAVLERVGIEGETRKLIGIADHFISAAEQARNHENRKLPD